LETVYLVEIENILQKVLKYAYTLRKKIENVKKYEKKVGF